MGIKHKVAVIGAGGMALEHIKAFKSLTNVELCGIYSRTTSKAEALAKQFEIPIVASSVEELFSKTKASHVVVTVNVIDVARVVLECSKFNWSILAEKPIGLNFLESEELIANVGNAKNRIFAAFNRRFLSSSLSAISLLSDSSKRIIEVYDQQSLPAALAGGHPQVVVDNWMYANSIHMIDLIRFFGRGEVQCVTSFSKWKGNDTDFVASHIKLTSGDEAIYRCFFKQPGPWAAFISNESVRLELRPLEKLSIQKSGERILTEIPRSEADNNFKPGFVVQAEKFLEGSGVSLTDSHNTMKLINEIYGV